MKLRDWYEFNFNNEQFKCHLGDVYVKVFKGKSLNTENMILEQLMNHDDMIYLFEDYELLSIGKDNKNGYSTISVLICKEN